MGTRLAPLGALVVATLVACGGGSSNSSTPADAGSEGAATVCTPGQSVACIGPGGCSGGQACKSDGSGYEACDCSGGGGSDAGGDAMSGQDSGATDSGGGETGADGGACSPSSLGAQLVLWLEGDVGLAYSTSTPVSLNWNDQSGTMPPDNSTSDAPPVNPSIDTAAVNGHTAVRFDGTNQMIVFDTPSLQWGTGDFGVELVMSSTASVSTSVPIFTKVTGQPGMSQVGVALEQVSGGVAVTDTWQGSGTGNTVTGTTAALSDGHFHLVAMIRTGGQIAIRVDGVEVGSGAFGTDVSQAGSPIQLAGADNGTGVTGITGDIAEVIAVKGTVPNPGCLESYLKTKYNL